MSNRPRITITEHGDGAAVMTVRERDGGLETLRIVSGEFRVSPEDPDARIGRELWLARHGLPVELAGHPDTVDRWISEEGATDA